ncbi:MAG: cupin protein [Phycisphaerales bacterium]|nr:cupin protein [Phycisphaerales bacterium]
MIDGNCYDGRMLENPPTAQLIRPGQGLTLSLLGVTITVKASAGSTKGVLTLTEYSAPPRFAGAQPHFHKVMTETFYILEGTLTFTLDGRKVEASAGAYVIVPPMAIHGFSNPTDAPVKFLVTFNPGGMEDYFAELVELARSEGKWPLSDMGKVVALARRYDTYPPEER